MVTTRNRYKKLSLPTTKLHKTRKSSLYLQRNKLTRLTTHLRREASRIRRRVISSSWAVARPYLRAHSSLYTISNRRRLTRLQRFHHPLTPAKQAALLQPVTVLRPLYTADKAAKAKITSTLRRRKRFRYKKLVRLFLKRHRLRQLRGARQAKRGKVKKVRAVKQAKKVKVVKGRKIIPRRIRPLRRSPLHRTRRRTPPATANRRTAKRRRLWVAKQTQRKLCLRQHRRRKYRKLRLKLGKRVRARSRRNLLVVTKRYLRQHFHYRRLLFTQRVGVATQLLRTLRRPALHTAATKGITPATQLERSWRPALPKKGATKPQKKARPPSKKGAYLQKVLHRFAALKIGSNSKQPHPPGKGRKLTTFRLRKKGVRALRSRKSLTLKGKKGVVTHPSKGKKAPTPTKAVLLVKGRHNRTVRATYQLSAQIAFLTLAAQRRAVKTQYKAGLKTERARKALYCLATSTRRVKRYLTRWNSLPAKQARAVQITRLTSNERRHLFLRATRRHSTGTTRSLRKRLPVRALYSAPTKITTTFLPRKSQRRKRVIVRRKRTLIAQRRRKVRRRRSRRKVVATRKRSYPFTAHSPVHAGRTVRWKEKGLYLAALYRRATLTRTLFKGLLRAEQPLKLTPSRIAPSRRTGRAPLHSLLRLIRGLQGEKSAARLATTIRLLLQQNSLPTTAVIRLLLLKAASLPAVAATPNKKAELIALEQSWLLSTNSRLLFRRGPHSRLTVRRRPATRRLRAKRSTLRTVRLLTICPSTVSPLLPHRRLLSRLLQLKPRSFLRKHSNRSKASKVGKGKRSKANKSGRAKVIKTFLSKFGKRAKAGKQLKQSKRFNRFKRFHRSRRHAQLSLYRTSRHNWLRLRRYRRTRGRTASRITVRLRARARRFGYLLIRTAFNRHPLPFTVGANRHLATTKATLRLARRLQQQRLLGRKDLLLSRLLLTEAHTPPLTLLRSRLDSVRHNTRKALLWKARSPSRPAVIAGPVQKPAPRWYAPRAHRPSLLKHRQQEVRRLTPSPSATLAALPLLPPHRGPRTTVTAFKRSRRPGRFQRIARTALRPKRLPYWAAMYPHQRNEELIRKARVHRVHAFRRSILFRKNRFFICRKATRGYRENLRGKLLRRRAVSALTSRPLRGRLLRTHPLRRSLRRLLKSRRAERRKHTIVTLTRASTGRLLSKHVGAPRPGRATYWNQKHHQFLTLTRHASTKKVQTVNQLLDQFTYLSNLPLPIRALARKATPRRRLHRHLARLTRKGRAHFFLHRQVRAFRKNRRPLLSLFATRRRLTKRYHLRSLAVSHLPLTEWHRTTLRFGQLRRGIQLRCGLKITALKLRRFFPGKTPGKYRWMRRTFFKPARKYTLPSLRTAGLFITPRKIPRLRVTHVGALLKVAAFRRRRRTPLPKISLLKATTFTKLPLRRKNRAPLLLARRAVRKQLTPKPPTRKFEKGVDKKQPPTLTPAKGVMTPQKLPVAAKTPAPESQKAPFRTPLTAAAKILPPSPAPTKAPLPTPTATSHLAVPATLSGKLKRKIEAFNRAPTPFSKEAYDALMSGLKAAWTALESATPETKNWLEADAKFMEEAFGQHYGEVARFNKKALLDYNQRTKKENPKS